MKLIFKVLLLIGIIAIGKWERGNSFNFEAKPASISYPVYTKNTSQQLFTKQMSADGEKKLIRLQF